MAKIRSPFNLRSRLTLVSIIPRFYHSGGRMKKIVAILLMFPAFTLIGAGEVSTQGSFALEDLINIESKAVHVPVPLVYAVIRTESRGNPLAESKAGCRGLMQISEEVWNIFMKEESWSLAYDPQENVRCGIRYLGDLYQMYLSWEKVLRHYHSGDPYSKREVTNRYVNVVLKGAGLIGGDSNTLNARNDEHRIGE